MHLILPTNIFKTSLKQIQPDFITSFICMQMVQAFYRKYMLINQ